MGDALAQLFDFAYRVPALVGYGGHWPITPGEAKTLGRCTEACLKAIPPKQRSKAVRAISMWLPWISLTTTAYIITWPRVLTTRLSMARGGGGGHGAPVREAYPGGDGAAGDSGTAAPDGWLNGVRTWDTYRR